tara:strand:+ start:5069 stop:5845 length:777 start_codon:yes stop_codon:yes gene_type:complete
MAFNIITRTIAGSADSMLQFSNGTVARYFSVAATWTRMRLFWRWQIPYSIDYIPAGNKFYAGIFQTTNDPSYVVNNTPIGATAAGFFGLEMNSLTANGSNTYTTPYSSLHFGERNNTGFSTQGGFPTLVASAFGGVSNAYPLVVPAVTGSIAGYCMEVYKTGLTDPIYGQPIVTVQAIYSYANSISANTFPTSAIDLILNSTLMSDVSAIMVQYGPYISTNAIPISSCSYSGAYDSICFADNNNTSNIVISDVYASYS